MFGASHRALRTGTFPASRTATRRETPGGVALLDDTFRHEVIGRAFDALPVGAIIHDAERIVTANRCACEIMAAQSPSELAGSRLDDRVHPDGREGGAARRAVLFERDQLFRALPVKMLALSGAPFTLTVSAASFTHGGGRYAVVASCSADRLDPPTAEPTPRAAGCLAEAALESFPLPVLCVRSGHVSLANASARALLGYSGAAGLLGESAIEVLHPDARDAMRERAELLERLGTRPLRIPMKVLTKDGRGVHVSSLAAYVDHPDGGVFMFVVTDARY